MEEVERLFASARAELGKVVLGCSDVIDLMLIALVSEGHVLIEGVPGTAKTLLVRSLAAILNADTKRVQFTPDLMPADIIGTNVLEVTTGQFHLRRGPIFTNLLLCDEINRAPAKTQSALLQAMQEREVTIDGITHPLEGVFMVFATQNPVELEGTYPLPEAQLDRFFFKALIDYPSADDEAEILARHHTTLRKEDFDAFGLQPVADVATLQRAKQLIRAVEVRPEVARYVTALVRRTRTHPSVLLGASPRGSLTLLVAAKACAAKDGREFVIPDDVKAMAHPVLRHRLLLQPSAQVEGASVTDILNEILAQTEVPR